MERRSFVAATSCALLAAACSVARASGFPGVLGVYAEFLDGGSPFVRERAAYAFSSASVIKLLVAVGTMRRVAAEGRSLDDTLPIHARDVVDASETFHDALPGSRASIRRLAAAMISQSDNTAANVLLDWCGMAHLNRLAERLSLPQTRFERHFMDFEARKAGFDNFISPHDAATLAKGIALGTSRGYAGATAATCRFVYERMLAQEDRETIPAGIERSVPVANKTGDLVGVRHDVAIVGLGRPNAYVVAVLSEGWTHRAHVNAALRQIAKNVDRAAVAARPG